MQKLDPPTQRVRKTLELCVSRIDDVQFKARAESITDDLEAGESAYEDAARDGSLFAVAETKNVGPVTKAEMVSLYEDRLSKKGHPAREIYDSIRAAPKFSICPLCGHRHVKTLDHHLPKSSHPLFAITPVNLVPCCSDCNKAKLADVAEDEATQPFHPYFDDFDDAVWLGAEVVETSPPAVRFIVLAPSNWSEVKRNRTAAHFERLELAALYGSNAAEELSGISGTLLELARTTGAPGVKAHLEVQARSRSSARRNSWRAALYEALAKSEWFCGGGHASIQV